MMIDQTAAVGRFNTSVRSSEGGENLAGLLSRISPPPQGPPATAITPPARRRLDTSDVDWRIVVELRRKASERISSERASHRERTGVDLSGDDVRMLGQSIVRQAVESHAEKLTAEGQALWSTQTKDAYVRAVMDLSLIHI